MKKKHASPNRILVVFVISIAVVLVLMGTASTLASSPRPDNQPMAGQPPTVVNYQGTLREDGGLYEGTGYFKFAVMDSSSGNGSSNYWAHDGTSSGEPTTYMTLTVTNGLFNVMLGDTSLTGMTEVISDTVFSDTNTYLRVWFSDSPSGFQALEPNQQFASVAYALRAQYAEAYTESDPVFLVSAAATINATQINNWTQAYNWGNHALAGYDTTDDSWTDSGPNDVYVQGRNVGIDVMSPGTLLHIGDNTGSPAPQLRIEQPPPPAAPIGGAYQEYLLRLATGGGISFSTGIDRADGNFKTTNTGNLAGGAPSFQGDMTTMYQAYPNGILDFNNQSRSRASLNLGQPIPPAAWTPIQFDDDVTPPGGYDQQGEFTLFNPTGTRASFIPLVEGYYQVHARTAFEYREPAQINPMGYVSIAIFVNGVMYAQGNNLQMIAVGEPLFFNNAPNVSDVVWMVPGDLLEIYVYQDVDFTGLLSLGIGPDQTYVSIHKDS